MYVSDADALMAKLDPQTPAQQMRFDLALELLDDVRRLDAQIKESHRRIRVAIKASGTSLTEIYGVGPIHRRTLIGYSGDVRRFANRDAYASYNGTAPIELSSGGRVVHRLSQRGNRKLNHALHMAAITQIRNPGTRRPDLLRAQARRRQDQEGSAPVPQAPDQQRRLPPARSSTPDRGSGRTLGNDS